MSQMATEYFPLLLRCSLFLSLAAMLTLWLRTCRHYPRLSRGIWVCVLLQGVFVFQWQVSSAWLPGDLSAGIDTATWHRQTNSRQTNSWQTESRQLAPMGPEAVFSLDERPSQHALPEPQPVSHAVLQEPSELPWRLVAAWCWMLGVALIAGWQIVLYRRFLQQLDYVKTPTEWIEEWTGLIAGKHSCNGVAIQATTSTGPLICRRRHNHVFLVPYDQWSSLSAPQRRSIMQHEIAHLQRSDTIKSLLVRLLALPQWFNPFAWIAVREFEKCAEFACDDALRREQPEAMVDYARALQELGQSQSHRLLVSTASGHPLVERIQRLLTPEGKENRTMKLRLIAAALAILILSGSNTLQFISAQESDTTSAKTTPQDSISPDTVSQDTVSKDETSPNDKNTLADQISTSTPIEVIDTLTQERPTRLTMEEEAVVDMARLFKSSHRFQRLRGQLQARIQQYDEELQQLVRRQKSRPAADLDSFVQFEVMAKRSEIQEKLAAEESRIFLVVFTEIQEEVSRYSRENGIRLVRRASSQPIDGSIAKLGKSMSPQEVIALMNRPIIFNDDQPRDITQAILVRLQQRESERQAGNSVEEPPPNPNAGLQTITDETNTGGENSPQVRPVSSDNPGR